MATGVWSGSLTFGLVNLPVVLVSALRPDPASLRMLHADDAEPLERRMHCPECDEDVPDSEQVRGFRIESDEYVEVTDDELEALAPERSQAIEIERFVAIDEIEPLYYDRPYFLLPDEGAEKAYGLLVEALADGERAGIAKLVLAGAEHLVAVMAGDRAIRLHTLRFRRQVVDAEAFRPDASASTDDERYDELLQFIDDNSGAFDPADYADDNARRLLRCVRSQAEEQGVARSSRSRRKKATSRSRAADRIDDVLDDIENPE
jgi:DNA end-binding protein Ku